MGVTGLLYNWGFFTLLAYSPYLMKLDAIKLGFVFFGWGLLLAAFAVSARPGCRRCSAPPARCT